MPRSVATPSSRSPCSPLNKRTRMRTNIMIAFPTFPMSYLEIILANMLPIFRVRRYPNPAEMRADNNRRPNWAEGTCPRRSRSSPSRSATASIAPVLPLPATDRAMRLKTVADEPTAETVVMKFGADSSFTVLRERKEAITAPDVDVIPGNQPTMAPASTPFIDGLMRDARSKDFVCSGMEGLSKESKRVGNPKRPVSRGKSRLCPIPIIPPRGRFAFSTMKPRRPDEREIATAQDIDLQPPFLSEMIRKITTPRRIRGIHGDISS